MLNSHPFNYHLIGQKGPILVFIHGLFGNLEDWLEVSKPFQRDFRCLLIDLPGHGQSSIQKFSYAYQDPLNPMNFEKIILLLGQFLQDSPFAISESNKAHLIGYSLGGRVALGLKVTYPQLFSTVILESANPGIINLEERKTRLLADQNLLKEITKDNFPQFLHRWYQQPLFANFNQHPNFPAFMVKVLKNDPVQIQQAMNWMSIGRQPNYWPYLSNKKNQNCQVNFISGALDQKYYGIGEQFGSHHFPIADCGHNTHWQNPTIFQFICERILNLKKT